VPAAGRATALPAACAAWRRGFRRMNEAAARRVVLVRAFERAPASDAWSEADRDWATRAAAQVEGERASDDAFIARRAALAVERLAGRDRRVAPVLASVQWPAWIGWVVPLLAFAAGAAADSIGAGRQVNLLAPPLLALLAWNLGVYALIVVRGAWGLFDARARGLGPLARLLARAAHVAGSVPKRAGRVAAEFVGDWMQASGTLTAARLGRVLHASAAACALGALAALYLRGIAFEYRAGWESTFLGAPAVQALLDTVLGPASAITGIALPAAGGYEPLRFADGGGVSAAPWLHLYAVTIGLAVLLPRLLLALGDRWLEARLAARFPLPLDAPYFRALLRELRAQPMAVRIAPYAITPAPQATLHLNAFFTAALGARTAVSVAAATAFGAEDDIDPRAIVGEANLLVPLFALTATPEAENHGAFIERLKAASGEARVVALVDESAFRRQFGADGPRTDERRALWRQFAVQRAAPAVFVDLERADQPAALEALRSALAPAGAA
jgi:hypothetical protein